MSVSLVRHGTQAPSCSMSLRSALSSEPTPPCVVFFPSFLFLFASFSLFFFSPTTFPTFPFISFLFSDLFEEEEEEGEKKNARRCVGAQQRDDPCRGGYIKVCVCECVSVCLCVDPPR